MRKVIAELTPSLDGFMKGHDGYLDWLTEKNIDPDRAAYASNFLSGFDTIFFGRVTYELFGLPRPVNAEQPEGVRKLNETLNCMRKYVFSRTLKHVAGNGMVVCENLAAEVKRIRDEDGKDIWLCGGPNIVKSFAALDLIDAYMLAVQPKAPGWAKPLFRDAESSPLKLLEAKNLRYGVVMLHYQPEPRITNQKCL
jgi:dihydrofolate reductase